MQISQRASVTFGSARKFGGLIARVELRLIGNVDFSFVLLHFFSRKIIEFLKSNAMMHSATSLASFDWRICEMDIHNANSDEILVQEHDFMPVLSRCFREGKSPEVAFTECKEMGISVSIQKVLNAYREFGALAER